MSTRIGKSLIAAAFVAGLAPLISAGPSDPSRTGSGPPAAGCPADDRTASNEVSAESQATSPESLSARAAWLVERERVLSSLVEVRRPDGAVSVDLQEAFWSRIVMQRNPDGSISIRCFPAGSRVVLPLAPAHPKLEEK